jgi:hypothetical protein
MAASTDRSPELMRRWSSASEIMGGVSWRKTDPVFTDRVAIEQASFFRHSGAVPTGLRKARPGGTEPGISRFRVHASRAPE